MGESVTCLLFFRKRLSPPPFAFSRLNPKATRGWRMIRFGRTGVIDADVLAFFRGQGRGYQTRINAVLRSYVDEVRRHKLR
jgi:hypothetical protein